MSIAPSAGPNDDDDKLGVLPTTSQKSLFIGASHSGNIPKTRSGHIPATLSHMSIRSMTDESEFGSLAKAVAVSAASSILSGYDQGVIAAAMLTMKADLSLSGVEQEVSIGCLNITAAVGGVLAGFAAELFGRKKAIAMANVFFLVGSFMIAFTPGFWLLLFGRMLQGVGVGFALVVAPIFTAELVPAQYRGMLVSLSDGSTNLGILLGYTAGLVFLDTPDGWRWMFGVGALPACILLGLIWLVPESPRWLVGVGRDTSAHRALNELLGDAATAERHLEDIQEAAKEQNQNEDAASWGEVFCNANPVYRTMIWRGFAIAFFSQAIGTEAVVYYSPEVVHEAGVTSVRQTLLAIMGVGFAKIFFLFVGSQLFDRVGRRPMLLTSAAGLFLSLLLMAWSCIVDDHLGAVLAIVGLCAYMGSFSIGFSPLTYVICSELFPTAVRAPAMSVALFTTRVIAGVISSSFVSLREWLTPMGAWLAFTPIAAAAFIFVFLYIPETMGHSLEEISDAFTNKTPKTKKKAEAISAPAVADGMPSDNNLSSPML